MFIFLCLQIVDGRFFVVSDAYCRTGKYLTGLALGVPPVSYDWIKECIARVQWYTTSHSVFFMCFREAMKLTISLVHPLKVSTIHTYICREYSTYYKNRVHSSSNVSLW